MVSPNKGTLMDLNTDIMPNESIILWEGFPGSIDRILTIPWPSFFILLGGPMKVHSNSPYPGSLGPGTALNSETPGSWNNPTVPQNKYDLVYTDIYIYTF